MITKISPINFNPTKTLIPKNKISFCAKENNIDRVEISKKPGKHKIPRYVYHLTNKEALEEIKKSGKIKTSNSDYLFSDGIYTIELENFVKDWGRKSVWDNDSLHQRLLLQTAGNSSGIVALRIPTEKLDSEKFKIRSQDRFFMSVKPQGQSFWGDICEKYSKTEHGWHNLVKDFAPEDIYKHCTNGDEAKNSHLYKQRKEAIEYIYQEDIPLDIVDCMAECDVADLEYSPHFDRNKIARSFFMHLFEGMPEQKAVSFMKE